MIPDDIREFGEPLECRTAAIGNYLIRRLGQESISWQTQERSSNTKVCTSTWAFFNK